MLVYLAGSHNLLMSTVQQINSVDHNIRIARQYTRVKIPRSLRFNGPNGGYRYIKAQVDIRKSESLDVYLCSEQKWHS